MKINKKNHEKEDSISKDSKNDIYFEENNISNNEFSGRYDSENINIINENNNMNVI